MAAELSLPYGLWHQHCMLQAPPQRANSCPSGAAVSPQICAAGQSSTAEPGHTAESPPAPCPACMTAPAEQVGCLNRTPSRTRREPRCSHRWRGRLCRARRAPSASGTAACACTPPRSPSWQCCSTSPSTAAPAPLPAPDRRAWCAGRPCMLPIAACVALKVASCML